MDKIMTKEELVEDLMTEINLKNYKVDIIDGLGCVIRDKQYGFLLDDNNGYGYKNGVSAHKGYSYKLKNFRHYVENILRNQLNERLDIITKEKTEKGDFIKINN